MYRKIVWVQYIGERQILTTHAANSAMKYNANVFIYTGRSFFFFFPIYTWMCKLSMCFLLILLLLFLTCWMSSCSEDRQAPDSWMWLQLLLFHFEPQNRRGEQVLKCSEPFLLYEYSAKFIWIIWCKTVLEKKISLAYAFSLELHLKQKYFLFYFETLFLHPSQGENWKKEMHENM